MRSQKDSDSLIMRHIELALKAAERKLKVNGTSDRSAVVLARRLRALKRDLEQPKAKPASMPAAAPAPAAVYIVEEEHECDTNQTIDQLCAGRPAWQQAQMRELDERPY